MTKMLIFVGMMTARIKTLIAVVLCSASTILNAQFANNLENSQEKPTSAKAEFNADSSHYNALPHTLRDTARGITHWIWTEFDKFKSPSSKDSSYIVYARSVGQAKTWSDSRRISHFQGDCSNGDFTLKADAPKSGLDGEVYVCWASPRGVAFQRSLDSGMTWMNEEKIVAPLVNGWEQKVDGIDMDGSPHMAFDKDGAFKGRIYITWSDEKNGEKDKDVFLIYSDDRGENWTDPILVTYRPNHKEQFQPNIYVQPTTGKLFITFFDKQNYHSEKYCDLCMGTSTNGGLKFYFYRVNQEPIVLDSGIASVRGLAFEPGTADAKLVWSQLNPDNKLNIYSTVINEASLKAYASEYLSGHIQMDQMVSFSDLITLHFDLKKDGKIAAVITKPLDPGFKFVVLQDQEFSKGPNVIDIDAKKMGLAKGNYIVTLYYDRRNNFAWILK